MGSDTVQNIHHNPSHETYQRMCNVHTYYGFQTVCKCPFWALLVTLVTDPNQTWANLVSEDYLIFINLVS